MKYMIIDTDKLKEAIDSAKAQADAKTKNTADDVLDFAILHAIEKTYQSILDDCRPITKETLQLALSAVTRSEATFIRTDEQLFKAIETMDKLTTANNKGPDQWKQIKELAISIAAYSFPKQQ